jgi:hypothetical protein
MNGTSSRVMRYRRVYTHGIPELAKALETGLLTEYRAGEIARLEPQAQQAALTIWTTRARQKQQSGAIAAVALRGYLASSSRIDLSEVCSVIRAAVAQNLPSAGDSLRSDPAEFWKRDSASFNPPPLKELLV